MGEVKKQIAVLNPELKEFTDNWLDWSKIVMMSIREIKVVKEDSNKKLYPFSIWEVVAFTPAGSFVIARDENSGVKDKCVKFVVDNWL